MKNFKHFLSFIVLLSTVNITHAKRTGTSPQPVKPTIVPPQPIPVQVAPKPATTSQQRETSSSTKATPKTYADALAYIKTEPTGKILQNNALKPEFINFVKSLNLSDSETKALLEAGINLHATWTGNNENDKRTLLSLKNTIESITQAKPTRPAQPTQPSTPLLPPALPPRPTEQPKKVIATQPKEQPKSTIPTPPSKPFQKPSYIRQPKPTKEQSIPTTFKTNNLMMILDPEKDETFAGTSRALLMTLLLGLQKDAIAPIIVSSHLLKILTDLATEYLGPDDVKGLRRGMLEKTITQFNSDLNHLANFLDIQNNKNLLPALSLVDWNNINVYLHKSEQLALLIPKKYIAMKSPDALTLSLHEQAKLCGFNPEFITTPDKPTTGFITKKLQRQESIPNDPKKFVDNLTALFTTKNNTEGTEEEKWTIYLTGHGQPITLPEITQEQLAFDVEMVDELNETLTNLEKIQKTAEIEQQIKQVNIWKTMSESRIKEYKKDLKLSQKARIAGLKYEDFSRLIDFFNNKISTAFLYYTTCFGGGQNQTFVNKVLSSLNVNFITVTEGVDERGTYAYGTYWMANDNGVGVKLEHQGLFSKFFELAALFIGAPQQFAATKGKNVDPVVAVIKPLAYKEYTTENQPFVRFPGAGIFGALSLDKNTKILTQAIVTAHEIEKKPIDLSKTEINTVVVNPSRIGIPLILNKNNEFIISPTPKGIDLSEDVIHHFKEIHYENTLPKFILSIINRNKHFYNQIFVIKKLTGITNTKTGALPQSSIKHEIRNLIIRIKTVVGTFYSNDPDKKYPLETLIQTTPISGKDEDEDMRGGEIGANIEVTFELNNDIYHCTLGIKSFKGIYFGNDFIIKKASFGTNEEKQNLASKILGEDAIAKLKQSITLESMIEFIDSRIDAN